MGNHGQGAESNPGIGFRCPETNEPSSLDPARRLVDERRGQPRHLVGVACEQLGSRPTNRRTPSRIIIGTPSTAQSAKLRR